jgi:formate hydrogenlyase subunit 3/multisubunit Na+/H+ antiporter MnhD subunit
MGIWTWPLLGVILIISAIGFYSTLSIMKFENRRKQVNDSPVSQAVKEHPYTMNPVVWVLVAALVFISVIIAYYAASSPN